VVSTQRLFAGVLSTRGEDNEVGVAEVTEKLVQEAGVTSVEPGMSSSFAL
jgi:hypothetical protein